jgi:hypothetical protein
MATVQGTTSNYEAAILSRVIRPEKDDLPEEQAKALLRLNFEQGDLDRLHELVVKNQDDELTPVEKEGLKDYLRVSAFLDLMHAKARYSRSKEALGAVTAWMPSCVVWCGIGQAGGANIAACPKPIHWCPSRSSTSSPASIAAGRWLAVSHYHVFTATDIRDRI